MSSCTTTVEDQLMVAVKFLTLKLLEHFPHPHILILGIPYSVQSSFFLDICLSKKSFVPLHYPL